MNSAHRNNWIRSAAALTGLFFLRSLPLRAQCALCGAAAAASGARGIEALKRGIWTLLIPTLLMFGIAVWMLVRRRGDSDEGAPGLAMSESEMDAAYADELLSLPATPDGLPPLGRPQSS